MPGVSAPLSIGRVESEPAWEWEVVPLGRWWDEGLAREMGGQVMDCDGGRKGEEGCDTGGEMWSGSDERVKYTILAREPPI